MRKVAATPAHIKERTGVTRFLLVTNPQNPTVPAGCVVVYAYLIDEPDGPSFTAWVFDDEERVLEYIEEAGDIPPSGWTVVPDQIPGCQDDWISPVRIMHGARGEKVYHGWERLVDETWQAFEGPSGGYGLQIDSPETRDEEPEGCSDEA